MEYKKVYLFTFVVVLLGSIIILRNEEKFSVIKKDFSDPLFLTFFAVISIMIILGLTNKNEKVKRTTVHAMVAFITAYFSHVNMSFAVFFLAAIIYYYSSISDSDTEEVHALRAQVASLTSATTAQKANQI